MGFDEKLNNLLICIIHIVCIITWIILLEIKYGRTKKYLENAEKKNINNLLILCASNSCIENGGGGEIEESGE